MKRAGRQKRFAVAVGQMVADRNAFHKEHESASMNSDGCVPAGPEPLPLDCCGGRSFLFGHFHIISGKMFLDGHTIRFGAGRNVAHGRWGPHIHREGCKR